MTTDPKLFVPALKLIKQSLEIIKSHEALATITDMITAYDERVVEFVREDVLVFADEKMRTTSISLAHVSIALEEAKRAYEEAYR